MAYKPVRKQMGAPSKPTFLRKLRACAEACPESADKAWDCMEKFAVSSNTLSHLKSVKVPHATGQSTRTLT